VLLNTEGARDGRIVVMSTSLSRREFLARSLAVAAGAPLAFPTGLSARQNPAGAADRHRPDAKVAIVSCRSYGPEVRQALNKSFDLLGGLGALVKNKTVTVKINLTGTDFRPFLQRPVGETYMTHYATALALGSLLFDAGARRVRFAESTTSRASLESTLTFAEWDVRALSALGNVEFENTRNLGRAKGYSHLRVPTNGYMFSSFEFNQAYGETDVMISLAKLKNHVTAGVTLAMKNLFGLTPNALYGSEAGSEDATGGRDPLHDPHGFEKMKLPGLKEGPPPRDATARVPRIVVDICAARPIHLSIIDGITSMSGGEGPWCEAAGNVKVTTPGVIIAGLNPVSTDAIGTAVMGYPDPRVNRTAKPFDFCDNHLLLAEQAGLGIAELARIDLRGMSLAQARYPYG